MAKLSGPNHSPSKPCVQHIEHIIEQRGYAIGEKVKLPPALVELREP
jgi:hypothetical protein